MNDKAQTISTTFPLADMQMFGKFASGIRFDNRFSLDDDPKRFIELVLDFAEDHKTKTFSGDRSFYRARINDLNDAEAIPIDSMGAPPKEKAGHGRLNPAGIPYLYLSSNQLTAISEVRAWVGSKVTVAEFALNDAVRLINFSNKFFQKESRKKIEEGEEFTWRELITWIFSTPFDHRDDTAYIPTQYISERIKSRGYDGIIYDSALNPKGYNVTLFDTLAASPKGTQVAIVKSIKIEATYKRPK